MDLIEAIRSRRSIRKFKDKKIPNKDILKLIESAIYAPSACDIQGWRFIIVDKPEIIRELVDRGAASFIRNTSQGILVLYDNRTDNLEYMDYIQSAAAGIQNILLVAHSLGIGTCWVCHLPSKNEIREMFGIPPNYDPIAYIAIGYPEGKVKERKRKYKVEEIVSYNRFELKSKERRVRGLRMKRFGRKIYYRLPLLLRRSLRPIADLFEKKF